MNCACIWRSLCGAPTGRGCLSARRAAFLCGWTRRAFFITAHDKDRGSFRVPDAVLVRDGKVEEGKVPSNAIPMHQAIYRRHPEVGAIVNAYPVNASAYGVSGVTLG